MKTTQIKILELIRKNPKITIKTISTNLKISQYSVQSHIRTLKTMGLVERVGAPTTGHWAFKTGEVMIGSDTDAVIVGNANVNQTQAMILKFMRENSKITARAIAERIKITPRSVQSHIRVLKTIKLVERVGSPRTGYWIVKTEEVMIGSDTDAVIVGNVNVTQTQAMILEFIRKDSKITARAIAERIKISPRCAQSHIQILKAIGVVDRVGSPRTGYWVVKTEEVIIGFNDRC